MALFIQRYFFVCPFWKIQWESVERDLLKVDISSVFMARLTDKLIGKSNFKLARAHTVTCYFSRMATWGDRVGEERLQQCR